MVSGVQILWGTPITLQLTSLDAIVALSPSLMVVVGSPYVLPVSLTNGVLTPSSTFIFVHGTSVNPEIAVLSPTSFALSYYQPDNLGNVNLCTNVGTVDPSMQVQFATAEVYAGDQVSHGILPLNSDQYLVIYPDLTSDYPVSGIGAPLVAQLVNVLADGVLYLPSVTAFLNGSLANYFFATARLTNSTGAVLFVDTSSNNALQVATIELATADFQIGPGSLSFGASIQVNTGDATSKTGLWMFIDLIALDSSRLVAAYSDSADRGRVVATICELTSSQDLAIASPTFVLSTPNPNESLDYYWVASTTISNTQFIVMDALYGSTGTTGGKVAFAELKASPLGVATQLSNTGAWGISVSGFVNVSTPLIQGRKYFATSQGALVTDDGVSLLLSPIEYLIVKTLDYLLFPRPGQYVTTPNNLLVSVDSLVGVAVTENTLMLKL